MLESLSLPEGVTFVRTTSEFTADTVPDGLRRAHRLAPDVWGLLRVAHGSVTFVVEETGGSRVVDAGDQQVIEPDTAHHVEPDPEARFSIEFYR